MKERLKCIRLALGFNQQKMAEKLNIPVRVYRNYEYVAKTYPIEFIQNLIEIFNINANYLFDGKGKMFLNSDNNSVNNNLKVTKLGNKLSEFQKQNNITDKNMAQKLGIYEYEYLDLKNGVKEPTFKILICLKKKFELSVDWLLCDD